jgi:hypothetical protein
VRFKVLTVVLVEDKFFWNVNYQGSIKNVKGGGEREIKRGRDVWQL